MLVGKEGLLIYVLEKSARRAEESSSAGGLHDDGGSVAMGFVRVVTMHLFCFPECCLLVVGAKAPLDHIKYRFSNSFAVRDVSVLQKFQTTFCANI